MPGFELINGNTGMSESIQSLKSYGVGIDTHSQFIQVCVLVNIGSEIHKFEYNYPTSWTGLLAAKEWIIRIISEKSIPYVEPFPLHYTIESTGTYHLPVLKAFEGIPSVVNPLLASPSRRKTDKLDAQLLAYHSLTGLWPESFVVNDDVQELRILMKQRNYHTKSATSISNKINNYILRFGHTLGRDESVTGMRNRAIIEDLYNGIVNCDVESLCPNGIPENLRSVLLDLFHQYDEHRKKVKDYEKLAISKANSISWLTDGDKYIPGDELITLLTSVPGVGTVTALVWLCEIVTPTRFKHPKQIAAYCGCDPSLKVSAGKVTSHTRRKGNEVLHSMLLKAASILMSRRSEFLGIWGYNIYKRHAKGGWKKASGAVARRLCLGLYYVHKTVTPFSYEQYSFYKVPNVPDIPIDDMGLGRFTNVIKKLGFKSSTELVNAYYSNLSSQKGVGEKCLTSIRKWIEQV